jgi:hypothetical protein
MRKMVRTFVTLLLIATFVGSLFLIGCTKHPNEKQLKALEETKNAAIAAEAKQSTCGNDQKSLQSQLADKKQKLEAMKQEKIAVNNRLQSM